jgi:ribonuclease-3
MDADDERLTIAEQTLQYRFRDRGLLEDALTHSSASAVVPSPNERLETLGDAVVTLVITEALFKLNPSADQGAITVAKSALVSTKTLSTVCRECGLIVAAKLGKGTRERVPGRIAANIFESIIGAVYLDGGLEKARDVILRAFEGHIENPVYSEVDPKSRLQQLSHELHGSLPVYEVVGASGPPHARVFRVRAVVGGRAFPEGEGTSKKAAERVAARIALDAIIAGMNVDKPDPEPTT